MRTLRYHGFYPKPLVYRVTFRCSLVVLDDVESEPDALKDCWFVLISEFQLSLVQRGLFSDATRWSGTVALSVIQHSLWSPEKATNGYLSCPTAWQRSWYVPYYLVLGCCHDDTIPGSENHSGERAARSPTSQQLCLLLLVLKGVQQLAIILLAWSTAALRSLPNDDAVVTPWPRRSTSAQYGDSDDSSWQLLTCRGFVDMGCPTPSALVPAWMRRVSGIQKTSAVITPCVLIDPHFRYLRHFEGFMET